jgi:DsbC/DsbD-like thiol-disulfide interchange protein
MFKTFSGRLAALGAPKNAAIPVFLLAAVAAAQAGDAPKWDASNRSAVRLIAGGAATHDGAPGWRAGVEIRLAPGWKTYWRYPGDSGVPPRFDFAKSENVRSATVRWPAPHRSTDDGGVSIGYRDKVVFPVTVLLKDAARPAVLRLDLDYAICEKLCIPANAKVEVTLGKASAFQEADLDAAESRVPKQAAVGGAGTFGIRKVTRDQSGSEPRILVDVAVPDGAREVDLFAEGPTAEWALPVPQPVDGAPNGIRRFAFALAGLPSGSSGHGATLTLTAVADEQAIEVPYRLD